MARHTKTLQRMRDNPQDDWKIGDLVSVATAEKLNVRPPTRGSHYTFSSPYIDKIETVPHNRPIKPIYVKRFLNLIDQHRDAQEGSR